MSADELSENDNVEKIYKVLLESDDLQKMQDHFCEVADVFCFCTDTEGNRLTMISGNSEEAGIVEHSVERHCLDMVYKRVEEGSLEDQAVEDTKYANLKVAAVSVRLHDKPILNWLVFGVLQKEDTQEEGPFLGTVQTVTTMKRFYKTLDLLREATTKLLSSRFQVASAEEESRSSKSSEKEMSESLQRIATFTEIVQLLESNESAEEIMSVILKMVGEYLHLSSCQIFRQRKDTDKLDLLEEWCTKGIVSVFDRNRGIDRFCLLAAEKTRVVSSDTNLTSKEKEMMLEMHLRAVVAIPIWVNGSVSMYASFCECKNKRVWQIDDVKFINDTVKILQSILTKRIQKNSLARSYEALESILDNVGCAIYVKDTMNGRMLFANNILKQNFADEIEKGTLDYVLERGIPLGRTNGNFEVIHSEKKTWYDLYLTEIRWVDGSLVSLYALYDITDKKLYQKEIEQQAYTDFLTGLYNRMCCERDLARYIDETKKNHTEGAVCYLDLDDFKHINDGLGHQYGDALLKAISHSLKRIEGIDNTCYRMGGDEFVIIIPEESFGSFQDIVEQITEVFSRPWFLKDADYYCTMSMGVVRFPADGEDVQDLIKKADIAMYEAKKRGKNRVSAYQEGSNVKSSKRLDMEKNMRNAMAGGFKEFEIYYQPIVDTRLPGTPCTGAEALIRWNSVELGFISPADFIPLAEYLGLINPIGNYVLEQACADCKKWNDSGHPEFKVNVNLSVVQLLQPDIVEMISDTVAMSGIAPRNLTLEVTESLAINDMERMKELLGKIRALGVRVALDDFGTGYSSLNHVREIPLDVIKVDQSFVKDLATNSFSQSFVKMVSELADAIEVNVCVEGIETKEQYEALNGMKVSLIQGFYFDRPMNKESFEKKYVKSILTNKK